MARINPSYFETYVDDDDSPSVVAHKINKAIASMVGGQHKDIVSYEAGLIGTIPTTEDESQWLPTDLHDGQSFINLQDIEEGQQGGSEGYYSKYTRYGNKIVISKVFGQVIHLIDSRDGESLDVPQHVTTLISDISLTDNFIVNWEGGQTGITLVSVVKESGSNNRFIVTLDTSNPSPEPQQVLLSIVDSGIESNWVVLGGGQQ